MNSLNGLEHEKGENRDKNFRRSGTLNGPLVLHKAWSQTSVESRLLDKNYVLFCTMTTTSSYLSS